MARLAVAQGWNQVLARAPGRWNPCCGIDGGYSFPRSVVVPGYLHTMSVVHRFYSAFAAHDTAGMGACYAEDARFHDPAFGELDAKEVRAMWAMLIRRSNDLRVTFGKVEEDARRAVYEWHAHYTFSRTGRPVHNVIRSVFDLRDGLIVRQRDEFDFWRWSRQALGPVGWLLGWSPLVRNNVRRTARGALARAMG